MRETPEPTVGLTTGIQHIFNNSLDSDLTVRCQGVDIKVHRVIIACQGGYFANAVKDIFKEGQDKLIELSDEDDPQVIKALLGYLYGLSWAVPDGYRPAIFEAAMYAAGDYYQLPTVKDRAAHNFKAIAGKAPTPFDGAAACFEAAMAVYQNTPQADRGLRDVLIGVVRNHGQKLIIDTPSNQETVRQIPQFALDLLVNEYQTRKTEDLDVRLQCPSPACHLRFGTSSLSNVTIYNWIPDNQCYCPGCGKRNAIKSLVPRRGA